MKRKNIISVVSVLFSLGCAFWLFLNWNPETLLKQEQQPVTMNDIEQGSREDFTGLPAGEDIPRLTSEVDFSEILYELDYVTAEPVGIVSTNVDHCFQKAGFDKKRLFYTQGDYGLFQCSVPCDTDTYDNEKIVRRMVDEQRDMKIPTELIPKCPKCGKPLTMNLRSDNKFVEDKGWHLASERYENFLRTRKNKRILFWELGVGYNTPVIIKYPFWQMTAKNSQAVYACVNYREAECPKEIEQQSICIDGDIGTVLSDIPHKFRI